ncbi:hypothetical protein [uncultured Clostridium sp.]|uniref:hypothetical protein n=1 Tax=uncultured Clostridium sp. TaxID=59620 RepID=UPI0026701F90|nr:hypothetical protein [uncultured Clostridium sp.]
MNLKKIKEILKNRKVQIITGTVAGVLALTVAGTIILNNKNVENKNIIVEKDDKKVSNEENIEIKEQLEELKSIDTSNMSDEEKKELENKIADTEKKVANNNDEAGKEVTSNTSISKPNSTSTTIENSSTSTNTNKGSNSNSKPSSGSSSNSNSSNNTGGSSTSGSTGGNTSNKEESHTHNWVPITSVVHHDEQGHNEKILVSEAWTEEIPIYEDKEVAICNGCGADITNNPTEHNMNHMLNGEKGGWHTEWKQVQVGTNKINHDAVYEDKWVVDKAAWDETVTTGYKCSSCGATK